MEGKGGYETRSPSRAICCVSYGELRGVKRRIVVSIQCWKREMEDKKICWYIERKGERERERERERREREREKRERERERESERDRDRERERRERGERERGRV